MVVPRQYKTMFLINETRGKLSVIETQRCIVRKFQLSDTDDLYKVLSNPEVMKFIEPPFTYTKTKNFIIQYGLCEKPLVWALELKESGSVIGHVIFHQYDTGKYEIGWIISDRLWGGGIASEVTKQLIKFAQQNSDISSLVLECAPNQEVTKYLAIKHGFQLIEENERNIYELQLL
jgi:ribosomal-protein-alanine N-acetyltransferase